MDGGRRIEANGIRLHVVERGAGDAVLLLHGFPDFHHTWRHQLDALAAGGVRAIAPDLRGYGASDRPRGTRAYAVEAIVADVLALLDALDVPRAVVVGHDWGGVIAWYLAMHHAARLRGIAILNAPHPATFARELARPSSQLVRSLYALAFQVPWLPEALLTAGDGAALDAVLRFGPARHDGDLAPYRAAFADREALAAGIDWYRAYLRHPPPPAVAVSVPTLVLWGMRDPFLVPRLVEGLERLHHTHAAEVNARLLRFVASCPR